MISLSDSSAKRRKKGTVQSGTFSSLERASLPFFSMAWAIEKILMHMILKFRV